MEHGVRFSEVSWGPGYLQGIDVVPHLCVTLDGDVVISQSVLSFLCVTRG